jgi:protease-4
VQGDHAQLAIAEKLVDGVKTRDELRDLLIERGARDEAHATFRQIHFHGYLARVTEPHRAGAIGVVLVEGEITDEEGRPGSVGGKQVAERIRRARRDDDIKALVLRVDSPGGSPYGSELIRRELELTRAAGKPVVVSMGDVAASGGYWVAMAADEVVADPSTITGSIGVIALIPTADKAMEKLAARTGGVSTTWLAGAYDIRRPLDKRFAEIVQMGVDHTYRQFTALAAASRRRGLEDIDAVAQGRVWSGYQAKQHGLVDTLGGLTDALRSAAQRAKLGEDYAVTYLEREPTRFDWLLSLLAVKVAALGGTDAARLMLALDRMPGVAATEQELSWLMQAAGADAGRPLAHCLCAVP